MQKNIISTKKLVFAAMLAALYGVLSALVPDMGVIRMSMLCFLPAAVGGFLMGPFYAAAITGLGDLLQCLIKGYAPNPLISLIAIATGLWYGFALYKRAFSWKMALLCLLPVFLVCEIGLTPWVLSGLYKQPFAVTFVDRLWSNLVELPIKTVLLLAVIPAVKRMPKSFLNL